MSLRRRGSLWTRCLILYEYVWDDLERISTLWERRFFWTGFLVAVLGLGDILHTRSGLSVDSYIAAECTGAFRKMMMTWHLQIGPLTTAAGFALVAFSAFVKLVKARNQRGHTKRNDVTE